MITRSAKAAGRGTNSPSDLLSPSSASPIRRRSPLAGASTSSPSTVRTDRRPSPLADPSTSSPSRRRVPAAIDLEEELARPTKDDYNAVRMALKEARSISDDRDIELENAKAKLAEKVDELRRCSEQHVDRDRIQKLEETIEEFKRREEERRNRGGSVEPEDEEPTKVGDAMVKSLRSAIHEFATKYFGDKLEKRLAVPLGAGWAAQFMEATTPGEKTYMTYLKSRRRCPLIIEAFIWRFLCGTIFNAAPWSGSEEMRFHVGELQKIFSKCSSFSSEPEQVRKYQIWKWKTTKLVLGLLEAGSVANPEQHRNQLELYFAHAVSEVITPFMRSSPGGHLDALVKIIHEAVKFDKAVSQIVPRCTWVFYSGPIESQFDFSLDLEGIMKLHVGEKASKKLARGTKTRVYLVVAPGLISLGADDASPASFEIESWLSPMEVTCVKPKRQRKFSQAEDSSDTTNANSPLPP